MVPVLVPLRDEYKVADGVTIDALPESSPVPMDYARLVFDHIRVPKGHILHPDPDSLLGENAVDAKDRSKKSLALRQNVWMAFALQLSAIGRAGIAIAVRHAFRRLVQPQGDTKSHLVLAKLESHNRPLLRSLAMIYATTALVNRAKEAWVQASSFDASANGFDHAEEDGDDPAWTSPTQLSRTLALVRALAARQVEMVIGSCARSLGASGVFDANRLVAYHGLTNILHPAAGDVHLTSLAAMREIGTGTNYSSPLPEGADVNGRSHQPSDALFWVRLLRKREHLLQQELQRQAPTSGQNDAAWDRMSRLGKRTVDAHIQRLQMDALLATAQAHSQSGEGIGASFDHLIVLQGINTVEPEAAWFISSGLLSVEQIIGLEEVAEAASKALADCMPELVDAFGLSNELLRASVLLTPT